MLDIQLSSITATKYRTVYQKGDKLNVDDIEIIAEYDDGYIRQIKKRYTTNVDSIDMSSEGEKILEVYYEENGITKMATVNITVKGNFRYNELDDGSIEISKYTGYDTVVEVPNEIDGKKVTRIGEYAFGGCSSLTEISIPSSVTEIGEYAFDGCSSLTEINIPEGVTHIRDYAFNGCSSLTGIKLPEGLRAIGFSAFRDCTSLAEINIPDSVYSLRSYAFYGCSSITKLGIENIKWIGEGTFYGCSSLTELRLPNVTRIDDSIIDDEPFEGCDNLVIYCKKDTELHSYAESNNISYILLPEELSSITATKTKTQYQKGDKLNLDDITVTAFYDDESQNEVTTYTTNADSIDMSVSGEKTLEISYEENGITKTTTIKIVVKDSEEPTTKPSEEPTTKPSEEPTTKPSEEPTTKPSEEPTTESENKKSQTIKVKKSYTKKYGDKAFNLNAKLSKGDGKLTYSTSNKKVATVTSKGKVTIKGTGSCTITVTASETDAYKEATAKISLTVKPAKNKISKIKVNGGKTMTVTWKKDTSVTGYEIQYSTSKSFTNKTTALLTVKNNKTTSAKIKKLTKGKKYYVRIRAYKDEKVSGKTNRIYGDYSAIKQSGKIK